MTISSAEGLLQVLEGLSGKPKWVGVTHKQLEDFRAAGFTLADLSAKGILVEIIDEPDPSDVVLICNFGGPAGSTVDYDGVEFEVREPSPGLTVTHGLCSRCKRPIYWSNRSPAAAARICLGCAIRVAVHESPNVKEALEDVEDAEALDKDD